MLYLLKDAPDLDRHEQIFIRRYEHLLGWALHLTDQDCAQAEDLVHDAFIQFVISRPDLSAIQNLDGYLYSILRFLRLSQLRRASRGRLQQLSIIDFDSAEKGLGVIDPREQMRVHDDLRAVCHYACLRKESSKAGSVMILRFFLGYFPSEIARVLISTRKVADMRLQSARREARAYLNAPDSLGFLQTPAGATALTKVAPRKKGAPMATQTNDGLLRELRAEIFTSRRGECLSRLELEDLYKSDAGAPSQAVDNLRLGHIVSCPTCLEQVNDILGLPPLAERYPTDMTGPDAPSGRGGNDNSGGGTAGGASGGREGLMKRLRRRTQEAFEHRPQELHICVNGTVLGSQAIHAELNELTLDISQTEPINFIEVFSEQETRLLLMPVGDAPPSGPPEHSVRVDLSDGRLLELTLSFRCPHPTLHAIYRDPLMKAEPDARTEIETEMYEAFPQPVTSLETIEPPEQGVLLWPRDTDNFGGSQRDTDDSFTVGGWKRRFAGFFKASPRFRPILATALILALLLTGALMAWLRLPVTPTVTAAELLQKSAAAEGRLVEPNQVLHRTFELEERDPSGNQIKARHSIETWQGTARGEFARRLYDEQGKLVAGEWEQADGARKLYQRAAAPHRKQSAETPAASAEANSIWRLGLSPSNFSALAGQVAKTGVEDRADVYVLSFEMPPTGSPMAGGLALKASLTLNKADLRATAQTLLMRVEDGNPQLREYRFVESGFKRLAAVDVPAEIFRPDPELSGPTARVTEVESTAPAAVAAPADAAKPVTSDLAALEVEARYLLDQANANLGEQVTVARTAAGGLKVQALVDDDKRKAEILAALKPLRGRANVSVEVATYAEAARQQPQRQTDTTIISEAQVAQHPMPAGEDLRRYFTTQAATQPQLTGGRPAEVWIAEQVERFAARMQAQATRPVRHAWAMKNLVGQITPVEEQSINADAKSKWLQLIRTHALGVQRETEKLRMELQPIFYPTPPADAAPGEMEESDVRRMADRLVELTAATDKAVSKAFSASAAGATDMPLKTAQFWQSVRRVERLAAALAQKN